MADTELDKTIEELEAEVMAELEEGMHDAPKKSAVPAEPMKKAKNGEMQDTGSAVVSPTQGAAPAKKVAGAAKEVSGDPQQKGEGKPQKMSKAKSAGQNKSLAAEGYTDEEIRELCHSKTTIEQQLLNIQYGVKVNQFMVHTHYQLMMDM